jgi:lipoprotein NlpI
LFTGEPSILERWPANAWPQLVLRFLAGQRSERELLDYAKGSARTAEESAELTSAAEFYVGFLALTENDIEKARTYLLSSMERNQRQTHEYWVAAAELQWLERLAKPGRPN